MDELKAFSYQTRPESDELKSSILQDYANLYGTVERSLFRDLVKKLPINDLKRKYLVKYGITARQFNACRASVQGKIASIKECRKLRIEELKEKIKSLEKKTFKNQR